MNELDKQPPPEAEEPEELADPVSEAQAAVPAQRSVARSAGIVSIAVMFSRVLGLVRETVFARFFGAGFVYDAFVVAFKVPNILRDLFAEGALSAAFVKVFTDYQIKKNEIEAWRLAALIFNLLAVVMSVITVIGVAAAPVLVPILAWNFPPEKAALAVTLTQIMFPFILLVALAALAMGVLNTKGKFGIPASASTAFNIASIVFGLLFAYWLSGGNWEISHDKTAIASDAAQWAIIGMAIGTLIGGAAQLLIQVPSLMKVGFRFSPVLSFRDPGVRRVMRLMGPAIIGTSAVQVKVLVDIFVVSGIEAGQSWLSYSFRLMQFPIGVFGVAIGTAAIPALSRLASENNIAKFRDTLSDAMKLVFLLTVPAACGLIVLGEPIIAMIYQGRAIYGVRHADDGMVAGGVFDGAGGVCGDQGALAVFLCVGRRQDADVCEHRLGAGACTYELRDDVPAIAGGSDSGAAERLRTRGRGVGHFGGGASQFYSAHLSYAAEDRPAERA
jgi:putative peptidoglycan lipid II flippase